MESKIISKYMGRERVPSLLCCFTMLLEYIGKEDSLELVSGRFKTVRGAQRVLPKIFNHNSIHDLVIESGFVEIAPPFAYSGDLVIDDFHTYIIYGDVLFGVGVDNTFKAHSLNMLYTNKNIKTYRRKE